MSILECSDCDGRVSSNAMTCVHCGNRLQEAKPGAIGLTLRVIYWLFCAALALAAFLMLSSTDANLDVKTRLIGAASVFGVWFLGSISIVVLLYVTRGEKTVRVQGATKGDPVIAIGHRGGSRPQVEPGF